LCYMSELNRLKGLQPSPCELWCYMSELNPLKGSHTHPFELCYMSTTCIR
jgi:hypothetical protein